MASLLLTPIPCYQQLPSHPCPLQSILSQYNQLTHYNTNLFLLLPYWKRSSVFLLFLGRNSKILIMAYKKDPVSSASIYFNSIIYYSPFSIHYDLGTLPSFKSSFTYLSLLKLSRNFLLVSWWVCSITLPGFENKPTSYEQFTLEQVNPQPSFSSYIR